MSKSSRMIWAAAEQSVGMPACPPDLSYPQYASLLFDKFCMVSCVVTCYVFTKTANRLVELSCSSREEGEYRDKSEALQKMRGDRVRTLMYLI